MSSSESGVGCVSEVTLAISKAKNLQQQQAESLRALDSPDSDLSGHSNSFTVQSFNYPEEVNSNGNPESFQGPLLAEDLRIPIVGYEVMEERARFTVYKLRVELKGGDCWFVFRRYTDFVRLMTQLRRQKIPIAHLTLPRKKWLGDNFAPSFLEERIHGLQAFVNGLLSSSELLLAPCVREFFCLDEPPTLSDTVEESRAIFEALEDTIYQLRQQLREKEAALALETNLNNELRNNFQKLLEEAKLCSKCSESI